MVSPEVAKACALYLVDPSSRWNGKFHRSGRLQGLEPHVRATTLEGERSIDDVRMQPDFLRAKRPCACDQVVKCAVAASSEVCLCDE